MSFSLLEKIAGGFFKKGTAREAEARQKLIYRDLPVGFDHQLDAKERIGAEANIAVPLQKTLTKRFPAQTSVIASMIENLQQFAATGVTPQSGYYDFRNLYFQTAGASNEQITNELGKIFPPPAVPQLIRSILGEYSSAEILAIADELKWNGVYSMKVKLPSDQVQALWESLNREAAKNNGAGYVHANEALTRFREPIMLAVPEFTQLSADPLFHHVASQYLGVEPVLSYFGAVISRPHHNDATTLSQSAQLFHADMSNPSFLKVFIYLNDVNEKNGPHCMIPQTHRQKASELWRDGRITDEEVSAYYPESNWAYQVGEAGSVIFVDTKAFHKGVPLIEGERHLIQFYYVDTLFGEHAPLQPGVPAFAPNRFGPSIQDYGPRFLSRYALAAQ
jgi:hypothetical protein